MGQDRLQRLGAHDRLPQPAKPVIGSTRLGMKLTPRQLAAFRLGARTTDKVGHPEQHLLERQTPGRSVTV